MEMEIAERPTASARRIAARRHRIRNKGRTNLVCDSKTKGYEKGLMMNLSRIWRARAAEQLGLAKGSEFRAERRVLEAKSEPSRLRHTQMVRISRAPRWTEAEQRDAELDRRIEHKLRVLVATQRHWRARDQRQGSNAGLDAEPNVASAETKPAEGGKAGETSFSNKANRSL